MLISVGMTTLRNARIKLPTYANFAENSTKTPEMTLYGEDLV